MTRRLQYFDQSGASVWLDPIDLFMAVGICDVLADISKSVRVLEVGVYRGAWIFSLAKNARQIAQLVGIDPYPGEHEDLRHQLPQRAADLGLSDRFIHFDSWEDMARTETDKDDSRQFDLIHVDGDHSFDGAALDLSHVESWLCTGGVVVVDDFYNHYYPGVAAATHSFIANSQFVMFLLTKNKVYLCRVRDQDWWLKRVQKFLDDSPLKYAFADWGSGDESLHKLVAKSAGDMKFILCLDEDGRASLLPSARDRRLRAIARDWLPPKIGAWLQRRVARN